MSGAHSRPSLAGKSVVIADDDPIIVEYLELRCRHLGMRVETAYDGLKAVLKVGKAKRNRGRVSSAEWGRSRSGA